MVFNSCIGSLFWNSMYMYSQMVIFRLNPFSVNLYFCFQLLPQTSFITCLQTIPDFHDMSLCSLAITSLQIFLRTPKSWIGKIS